MEMLFWRIHKVCVSNADTWCAAKLLFRHNRQALSIGSFGQRKVDSKWYVVSTFIFTSFNDLRERVFLEDVRFDRLVLSVTAEVAPSKWNLPALLSVLLPLSLLARSLCLSTLQVRITIRRDVRWGGFDGPVCYRGKGSAYMCVCYSRTHPCYAPTL
jgi:hypothetical protein